MKKRLILLLLASTMMLPGCKGSQKCHGLPTGDDILPTPYTDKLKFAQEDKLEGARFASDSEDSSSFEHYGYVTLRSCTDGDTANFVQEGYVDESKNYITIKTRFLGVNTPESTAKVEPWGKRASLFTKHILEDAQAKADEESAGGKKVYNIALITDPATMGERDSAGNRWLAFVWYRKSSSDKWRNLNLELVEQGYSKNQLFIDSKVCDYRKSFEAAGKQAEKCGYRVNGEEDDKFDYTTSVYESSLWGVIHHFDDLGISDDGKSGVQLVVTALVVGIQGDNMYLRDVALDEEQYELEGPDAQLAGMYAYAGYNTALCSTLQNYTKKYEMNDYGIGLVVRFFCRASSYSGNYQLTDVKTGSSGTKAFRAIVPDNFEKYKDSLSWSHEYKNNPNFKFADLHTNVDPIEIKSSDLDRTKTDKDGYVEGLAALQYQWVKVNMTIRQVTPSTDDDQDSSAGFKADVNDPYWYKPASDPKAYTVYAYITDKNGEKIYTNIRIDASLNPTVSHAFWGAESQYDLTPVGKTFSVTGYLAKYFDKFQIQLANNYLPYNYVTPVLQKGK